MTQDALNIKSDRLINPNNIPIKIHGECISVRKSTGHFSNVNILGSNYLAKSDLRAIIDYRFSYIRLEKCKKVKLD